MCVINSNSSRIRKRSIAKGVTDRERERERGALIYVITKPNPPVRLELLAQFSFLLIFLS